MLISSNFRSSPHAAARAHASVFWLLILGGGFLITSCATTSTPLPDLRPHLGSLRAATLIAVGLVLRDKPALAPVVAQVARDAQHATQATVDVTQLLPSIKLALARLPLASGDTFLLEQLADAVASEVQAYVQQAGLPPTAVQLLISQVLGWIADAADQRLGRPIAVSWAP